MMIVRAGALEKGKPVERRGRKATGPTPTGGGGSAGLPRGLLPEVAGTVTEAPGDTVSLLPPEIKEKVRMLQKLRRRLDRDEQGFTLIELMVVVLIIAILIAIAIPTFLGAQNRARDRGAQSDLRNGLTAAKTLATDSAGLFQVSGVNIVAADMTATEPSLSFVAMAAADATHVGVLTENASATDVGTYLTLVK